MKQYQIEGALEVEVRFLSTNYKGIFQRGNVRRGNVKDPYLPSVYGKGWIGVGEYVAKVSGKVTKEYSIWSGMMTRCYGHEKPDHWKSYRDNTEVSKEFLDFQKFAKWFEGNYISGWDLDKDVLSSFKGVSLYSEQTCIFLPPRINKCIIGQPNGNAGLPTGVQYIKKGDRYVARLSTEEGREYLGCYSCPIEAFKVYQRAKKLYVNSLIEEYKTQLPETTYKALLSYEVVDESPWQAHLQ